MKHHEQPYCLVLGGGGTKGVYHIGVWQALTELNIPVNAFIGNSIGAIVSAFLVQGAEQQLLEIAKSMQLKTLIRLHKDQALADENSLKDHSLSYWQGVYRNIVERKGLDTSPLRELLESALNEKAIRANGADFGITTVNVSDFKSREVFIDEMEDGQLINYVMASAAFPGFERPLIDGKKYIDGGLYDNVPFTMAKSRGYRKIILVDISGIGIHRRAKTEGTQTVFIKNSIDMGNAFEFDPDFIENFWHLGYLDTLRTFGELIGYQYFLIPEPSTELEFLKTTNRDDQNAVKSVAKSPMQHERRLLLILLEICADFLAIDRIKKYSYQALISAIKVKLDNIDDQATQLIAERNLTAQARSGQLLDALVKEVIDNKKRDDHPYFYLKLLNHFEESKTTAFVSKGLIKINPELKAIELFQRYFSKPK